MVPLCAPGAESRETAPWKMEGDDLLDLLPSVSQRTFPVLLMGASYPGLENLLVSAPIRQRLGLNSARKMSLFLYHLLSVAIKVSPDLRTCKEETKRKSLSPYLLYFPTGT